MTTVLPTPAPPNRPILPPFKKWLNQVDDLHSGLEHFRGGRLLVECGSEAVNRHSLIAGDRTEVVDGLADDVHHATQRAAADGNRDGSAEIDGVHAAHHAVGRLHGDAAHAAFAEVLLHFEDDVDGRRNGEAVADDAKRLINGRHVGLRRTARRRRGRRPGLRVRYFLA